MPLQHSTTCAAAAPAVRLSGVGVRIGTRWALQNVTLDLPAGASLAVLGANGAGKSSLLRVMSTLLRPTTGSMELFGPTSPRRDSAKHRVGFIGHQSMLYADLSARENLEFFATLYRLAEPRRRAAEFLEIVELSARANDAVRGLSRGMLQRVAVARALLHSPDLILADEPFTGLDERSSAIVARCLQDRHRQGSAMVIVSHDVAASLASAGRVLVLREGSVALHTTSRSVSAQEVRAATGEGVAW